MDAYLLRLPEHARIVVTIEVETPARTLKSLRYYYGGVLKQIAEYTGYWPHELHPILKAKFLGHEYEDDGERLEPSLPADADGMRDYIEIVIQFCSEFLDLPIDPPRR